MPPNKGSAAVRKRTPRSADAARIRSRIRSELPARLKAMRHTLNLASGALLGPDPESAMVYLQLLEGRIQAARLDLK